MNNNQGGKNVLRARGQFISDPSAETVPFAEIAETIGMAGERVQAVDLVGKTFTIYRAKPYNSTHDAGKTVYFCVIVVDGESEEKTVSLGGVAIVDMIGEMIATGFVNPVRVTLLRKDGEKDTDRYYYFG